MGTPLLISDKMVSFFKFWADGEVQQGMRCGKELFQYCQSADRSQRQQAYTIACTLAEAGATVVITTCGSHYKIWRSLRTPEAEVIPFPSYPKQTREKALLEQA